MPSTVPNQKVIHIHRTELKKNDGFLGINNDSWKYAARVLGAQAFLLYIYFASNKDNYALALSPAAVQQEIGMPRSTYHDQLRKLKSQGFIVEGKGNRLENLNEIAIEWMKEFKNDPELSEYVYYYSAVLFFLDLKPSNYNTTLNNYTGTQMIITLGEMQNRFARKTIQYFYRILGRK